VLKIETVRGFERLPEMLLAAMAFERIGVMVARGDLAVECGFERLSEVQEEILWLCERPMFRRFGRRRSSINWPEPANRHGLRFRTRSWPGERSA